MSRKRADRLIKSKYLITMAPDDRNLRKNHGIAIENEVIIDIGPWDEIERSYESRIIDELEDTILMPGFINTHGHLPMIGYCGKIPDGMPFESILFHYMLPIEREFVNKKDFVYLCSLLGARELALSGVTTSVEMYYNAREIIRAFSEIGLRGVIGETVISEFPSPAARSADEALTYIEEAYKELPKANRLVEIAVAPHSAYSCSDNTLLKSRNLAEKLNIPFLMHAQETPAEMEKEAAEKQGPASSFYRSRHEVTDFPLVHLGKLGVFNTERVLLAHCIYLNEKEIDILARFDVGASYNGICNTQIGLDIAPVVKLRKKGVPVGIGTDGPLTNDRIDILSQMLPLLCFQRHKNSSSDILSCYDILRMATIEAAMAIGMDYHIGSLEKGKKADIIGINLKKTPRASLYMDNDEVYPFLVKYISIHCIDFCLIDGRNPQVPEEAEILARLDPTLREIRAWKPPGGE